MLAKKLFAVSSVLILLFSFGVLCFADTPTTYQTGVYTPYDLRRTNVTDSNGGWLPDSSEPKAFGTFIFNYSVSDLFYDPYALYDSLAYPAPLAYGWDFYDEYVDADGTTVSFYYVTLNFQYLFEYMNHPSGSSAFYDSMTFIVRDYDYSGFAFLNDIYLSNTSLSSSSDSPINIWHCSDGTMSGTYYHYGALIKYSNNYTSNGSTVFGYNTITNHAASDINDYWFPRLLGNPNPSDSSLTFADAASRIANPVNYFEGGGAGPGGGGSGGVIDPDPDEPDTPVRGFGEFVTLVINAFKDILSIEFFGGWFDLGTLIAVPICFSLLFLIVKWFAGG